MYYLIMLRCTAPPPPIQRPMTCEELFTLLLPLASKWKGVGEVLGCGEDHLDEIFTNNNTDQDCLRNLTEIYQGRHSRQDMVTALEEMGEIELAQLCIAGKPAR